MESTKFIQYDEAPQEHLDEYGVLKIIFQYIDKENDYVGVITIPTDDDADAEIHVKGRFRNEDIEYTTDMHRVEWLLSKQRFVKDIPYENWGKVYGDMFENCVPSWQLIVEYSDSVYIMKGYGNNCDTREHIGFMDYIVQVCLEKWQRKGDN